MAYRSTERTEARRRETRARVVDAALALIAAGGYQAAGMSEVAAQAGVGVGTVYRQFPSKAELFAEVFRQASQREVDAVAAAAAPDGPAHERLARAVETFARRALAGQRLAWALLAEPVDVRVDAERLVFRQAYAAVFAALLADGVAAGELPAQRVELTAAALVGAIGEALVGPLAPTVRAPDVDAIVRDLVAFCQRAVTDRVAAAVASAANEKTTPAPCTARDQSQPTRGKRR